MAGFSLVEMAVVTLLIGIFLTMGLSAFRASQGAQAVSRTQTRENDIKDALIAYIRRNNRLPCADTDFSAPDGIENRATAGDPTTACATSPSNARFGIVPYVTLGLARDAAVDGWGNFFSYQVSNSFPNEVFNPGYTIPPYYNSPIAAPYRDWTLSANLRSGSTGELTIKDRNASGAAITVASNVVAVVVSYGANGFGAYTVSGTRNTLPGSATDEYQNTNVGGGTTYFRRTQTTDDAAPGGAFDDHVMFLTADDLLGPLIREGTIKSPAAQLTETFTKIENAIGAWAAGSVGYATYGGSSCNAWGSWPRCRVIPYADFYNGNGYMNGNSCASPAVYDGGVPYNDLGLSASDLLDPWGRPIRYTISASLPVWGCGSGLTSSGVGIGSTSPAGAATAYTLMSFGPDRAPGGNDDLSVSVTVTDLRSGLTGLLP